MVPLQKVHPRTFSSCPRSSRPDNFSISTPIAPCTTTGRRVVPWRGPHVVASAQANSPTSNTGTERADLFVEIRCMSIRAKADRPAEAACQRAAKADGSMRETFMLLADAPRDRALYADIVGGMTTFFTMAYIVVVNPGILAAPGTG